MSKQNNENKHSIQLDVDEVVLLSLNLKLSNHKPIEHILHNSHISSEAKWQGTEILSLESK